MVDKYLVHKCYAYEFVHDFGIRMSNDKHAFENAV